MNDKIENQLDKVLALVDSDHEGEAIVALRKARQLLEREGLSFADLARSAATRSRFALPLSIFGGQQLQLETEIERLQSHIASMENEQQSLQTQVEFWQRRATDIEQQLNLSLSDAHRWRQLARETIEKLWDVGQVSQGREFKEDTVVDLHERTRVA